MYIPSDPKIWREIKHDSFIRKPQFWLPLLGGGLIAYGIPEDVFQKYPLLETFVQFVSDLVPSIDQWSKRSSFTNTTRILFSYFWLLVPYYTFIIAKNETYKQHFIDQWLSKGKGRHFLPLLLVTMTLIFASLFYFVAFPEESNCRRFCIYESIVFQWLYVGCMTIGIAGLLSGMNWWLNNFKIIHFTQLNKGDRK